VVDDEEMIQALDHIVLKYVSRIYNVFYKPKIMSRLARMIGRSPDYLQAKPKLEAALERGYASHHPAAIVFVVGDRRKVLSEPSAQYVLYNMILYAQTKGIGSCLWANGPMFLDKNKAARERMSLHNNERIFGALLLGYPAVRFRNKVDGKRFGIQWNDGIAPDPSTTISGNSSST
jgi:nitroreductase